MPLERSQQNSIGDLLSLRYLDIEKTEFDVGSNTNDKPNSFGGTDKTH